MLLAVCVGVVIGCLTGFLVAKLGMPSFVVTLALFIAWQGVILQLIGDGGTLGLRDPVIVAVANGNLSTLGSWLLFVVGRGRLRGGAAEPAGVAGASSGWSRSPPGLVLIKIGAVVVLAAVATFLLTLDRSPGTIRSPACPTSCRSCSCCSSRAPTCSTAPGSAGTSTPSAATGRPRGGPASTSSRIRATVFVISSALRGDRRDRLLVEGRLGVARAPVAATRCCSPSARR